MLLIVGIIILSLFCIGYYRSKNLCSPEVLVPGIWLIVIISYCILPHNLYHLENRFFICLLLWVFGCFVSSQAAMLVIPQGKSLHRYNKTIYRYEVIFAAIATIIIAVDAIRLALTSDYFFVYLRALSTGLDENVHTDINPIWAYLRSGIIVVYLIALVNIDQYRKSTILILLCLNLLTCFITMAKSQLFIVIVSSIIILHLKKKISFRRICFIVLTFLFLIVIIQLLRMAPGDDSFSLNNFLISYLLSGSVAFDVFDPDRISQSGSNVFRFFEAVGNRLGISNIPANETILPYTQISPDGITNVYTIMYPFFVDYGYMGVFIFALINGWIYGYLYKKSKTNDVALIMYSLVAPTILFGFLGELLFTNMSTYIQYGIFVMITYYLRMHNYKQIYIHSI